MALRLDLGMVAHRKQHQSQNPSLSSANKAHRRRRKRSAATMTGYFGIATPRTCVRTMQEREELARSIFIAVDENRSGYIEKEEFASLLHALSQIGLGGAFRRQRADGDRGFDELLEREFARADTNKSGMVDFNEFVMFYNVVVNFMLFQMVQARSDLTWSHETGSPTAGGGGGGGGDGGAGGVAVGGGAAAARALSRRGGGGGGGDDEDDQEDEEVHEYNEHEYNEFEKATAVDFFSCSADEKLKFVELAQKLIAAQEISAMDMEVLQTMLRTDYRILDLKLAARAYEETQMTLPFVRVLGTAGEEIDAICQLENDAVKKTGDIQESLLHLSRADHDNFFQIINALVADHTFTLLEGDQLKAIVEACELPMRIRGAFARFQEHKEIDGFRDMLDGDELGADFRAPAQEWQEREEFADVRAAGAAAGADESAGGGGGAGKVNAVHVIKARRNSVGFTELEAQMFARAANDFYDGQRRQSPDATSTHCSHHHDGVAVAVHDGVGELRRRLQVAQVDGRGHRQRRRRGSAVA